MNVVIEDDSKKNKKLKFLYICILLICIISIVIAVIIQLSGGNNTKKTGENKTSLPSLSDDQVSQHKNEFDNIFTNKVNYLENNSYKVSKIKQDQEIIYLGYNSKETKLNDYELNVNIPYININNEIIDEFNTDIKDTFEKKAKSIIDSQNNNVIYTVNYSAYVSNNILSLVVRSTLKEGSNNPQRDIVQTYNYDLSNQKKVTIDDMLELKGITKKEANQKIKEEIKLVQQKVENFKKLGYNIYERDYTNDMYSVNNVTEYFMGENNALYIIYAYGNQNYTSEMDIVVM